MSTWTRFIAEPKNYDDGRALAEKLEKEIGCFGVMWGRGLVTGIFKHTLDGYMGFHVYVVDEIKDEISSLVMWCDEEDEPVFLTEQQLRKKEELE